MSSFGRKVRITLLKGMEAIGTTAASLASNAKVKVNELNLESRRREILTDFSLQAFELWQKGVQLPAPLSDMFTELSDIESRLSVLRAQKFAKVNCTDSTAAAGSSEAAPPAESDSSSAGIPVVCSVLPAEDTEPEPVAENTLEQADDNTTPQDDPAAEVSCAISESGASDDPPAGFPQESVSR